MGTKAYSIAYAVGAAMNGGTQSFAEYLGASPVIKIFNGTPPANADTALSGNTLLATLTGSATPLSGNSQVGQISRATWAAITSAVAAATGTATCFRTYRSDGTTVVDQGNVDLSGADLNLSTTSLSAGSTVSCSGRTNDIPLGP